MSSTDDILVGEYIFYNLKQENSECVSLFVRRLDSSKLEDKDRDEICSIFNSMGLWEDLINIIKNIKDEFFTDTSQKAKIIDSQHIVNKYTINTNNREHTFGIDYHLRYLFFSNIETTNNKGKQNLECKNIQKEIIGVSKWLILKNLKNYFLGD